MHRSWSRAEILVALANWVDVHGRTPTRQDWSVRGGPTFPSASWVHTCFGSWNAMLEAGGLSPHLRRWTRTEVLEACAAMQAHLGRPLRGSDFDDADLALPSITTLRRRIGGVGALHEALNGMC